MTILTERALHTRPDLDPASVEAGVQMALEATREALAELEDKLYHSPDIAARTRWLAVRGASNVLHDPERF